MNLLNPFRHQGIALIPLIFLLSLLLFGDDASVGVEARLGGMRKHRRSGKGAVLAHHSKAYKLRKGSRLERQHRRSMHNWRRGYLDSLQPQQQQQQQQEK